MFFLGFFFEGCQNQKKTKQKKKKSAHRPLFPCGIPNMTWRVKDCGRSACFSDGFSAGLNDAKIVLGLQWLASPFSD